MTNAVELIHHNIRNTQNLPAHQMSQHHYPRIAVNDPGPDGEITVRLISGLPCCGLDTDLECPPTLTIAELGKVVRWHYEFVQQVKSLPTFSVCRVKAPMPIADVA